MDLNPIRYSDLLGDSIDPVSGRILTQEDLYPEYYSRSDNRGVIVSANKKEYDENPAKAFFKDAFYYVSNFTGINSIDNFISNRLTGSNSTGTVLEDGADVLLSNIQLKGIKIEGANIGGKIGKLEIKIPDESKIDRSLLNPPDKPGNAPTFKKDNTRVEIHHVGQNPDGPFIEMHRNDHRLGENYRKNHTNEQKLTKEQRTEFNAARKIYWWMEYFNKK